MIALLFAAILTQDPPTWRAWGVPDRWSPVYVGQDSGFFVDKESYLRLGDAERLWFYYHPGDGTYQTWEVAARCSAGTVEVRQAWRGRYGAAPLDRLEPPRSASPVPGTYDEVAFNLICGRLEAWPRASALAAS